MTEETIFANADLVLENEVLRGALVIRDGLIASIEPGRTVPCGAIDCEGDLIAPGLVELHTDNLERHLFPRPKVEWPHAAAISAHDAELAVCGITTVFDALRLGTTMTSTRGATPPHARQLADGIHVMRNAGMLRISHHLHLRAEICSQTLAEELDGFAPEDRVGIVSLMDHTPGQRQFSDLSKLSDYMRGKHGMNEADFDAHVADMRELSARLGPAHEEAAVSAARALGAALASHDDSTADQVAASLVHGVAMAEFPTTTEAARACCEAGIAVIMGAPNLVRGGSHSGNVAAQELAEAGWLDILSSDYVPAALLQGAWKLGDIWGNRARGMATVTSAPARATGLCDRGSLRAELRADIIRIHSNTHVPTIREVYSQGKRVA